MNASAECLVGTVLAPGLSDGFQFDVGGISPQAAEVILHGLHFRDAQVQLTLFAEHHQFVVVHFANSDGGELEFVIAAQ